MPSTIESALDERGKNYGVFATQAKISQSIKAAIFQFKPREDFEPYLVEALEMIAHKIARIVNGDPKYADSPIDIAGYATLILQEIEREIARDAWGGD